MDGMGRVRYRRDPVLSRALPVISHFSPAGHGGPMSMHLRIRLTTFVRRK